MLYERTSTALLAHGLFAGAAVVGGTLLAAYVRQNADVTVAPRTAVTAAVVAVLVAALGWNGRRRRTSIQSTPCDGRTRLCYWPRR